MKTKLNDTMRTILEGSIDAAIGRKERLRTEAEHRLERIQYDEQIAGADIVGMFRLLLDLVRAQESVCTDRWNLTKF